MTQECAAPDHDFQVAEAQGNGGQKLEEGLVVAAVVVVVEKGLVVVVGVGVVEEEEEEEDLFGGSCGCDDGTSGNR
jgi:hypothetical protein